MVMYFTSDTHWYHFNIIKFCNRPFANVEEMNEALIERWNERVNKDDTVFHLGDFGFSNYENHKKVFDRLTGRKILIKGNHDGADTIGLGWDAVTPYYHLRDKHKPDIIMFHYPMITWDKARWGSLHLYGHVHGRLKGNSQSLDVGADCWDYRPINIEEIKERMATLPKFIGEE